MSQSTKIQNQSIVTFGEIMLRLKSPERERLFQSPNLEATFGGGEANVSVSLSLLGKPTCFVSALPANPLGDQALRTLQSYSVDTSQVLRQGNRMGIYFLETGSNQRPSQVVYDRDYTAISQVEPGQIPWNQIFAKAQWFHITGITPALSQKAADSALEAVKQAKKAGVKVSIDLNYRKKLWNYGKQPVEVMSELVNHATVIIANEEDIQKTLNITGETGQVTQGHLDLEGYRQLITQVQKTYPNLEAIAITLRESISADQNGWSAIAQTSQGFFQSKKYQLTHIVDRVGGGDSFSAGLIFGMLEYPENHQKALDFAVAASALKHTISGDFNLVNRQEVEALLAGDGSGRVQR
jgi:2-dehydro-3-deoxygluconokinase